MASPGHPITMEMHLSAKMGTSPGTLSVHHGPKAKCIAVQRLHTHAHTCRDTHTRIETQQGTQRPETNSLPCFKGPASNLAPHLTAQPRVVLMLWVKLWVSLTVGLSSLCVEGSGTLNVSVKEVGLL